MIDLEVGRGHCGPGKCAWLNSKVVKEIESKRWTPDSCTSRHPQS